MTPCFDEAIELRNQVLREPLGIKFHCTAIEQEYLEYHLASYCLETNTLVATLSLRTINSEIIKMRQVAVLPSRQNQGIGKRLVSYSEHFARNKGYKIMELHARIEAKRFYEQLSYTTKGRLFKEVGIDHIKMFKEIS